MKSKIEYDPVSSGKYHDIRYYRSMQYNLKKAEKVRRIKKSMETDHKLEISIYLEKYKTLLKKKAKNLGYTLKTIYKKNQTATYNGEQIKNTHIIDIISSVPMLLISYKKIRKNTGATTLASYLPECKLNELSEEQLEYYNKTLRLPDGMTKEVFIETSKAIKNGTYPWGASRRIQVEKPGSDKTRPITIPPFMDRVVQQAIKTILEAIYEPEFDKLNCSFGFRPRKSCHNAIFAITSMKETGLNMALEGDIKSAYDKVNRAKLLNIIEKKITDKKFIRLLKKRLNYIYWDSTNGKYIEDKEGLPQGGIDSPYLWNIYFHEFDKFIIKHLKITLDKVNKKNNNIFMPKPSQKKKLERQRSTLRSMINIMNNTADAEEINTFINSNKAYRKEKYKDIVKGDLNYVKELSETLNWQTHYENKDTKTFKYSAIKYLTELNHEFHKISYIDTNRQRIRYRYARYADDFIILTNMDRKMLEKLKLIIQSILDIELKATLEMTKTKITNLREEPAHFLGFEIRMHRNIKIKRYIRNNKTIKARVTGSKIQALPDRQRLINRFTMKGFCDESGFPREIGKISILDTHMIIERYNQVINGLAQYYTQFIKSPRTNLNRWIYILSYSCYKTLAQKEHSSIAKIRKKYKYTKHRRYFKRTNKATIGIDVLIKLNGQKYMKTWHLTTLDEALHKVHSDNNKKNILDTHWALERGEKVNYKSKNTGTDILDENFAEKIDWINLRTQASFDMPCAYCGKTDKIHMHHIKGIRKKRLDLLKQPWDKIMALKNRLQIPLCETCHLVVVHRGKYGGPALRKIKPKIMYDNRLITIESIIRKTEKNPAEYTKTMAQKGWTIIQSQKE